MVTDSLTDPQPGTSGSQNENPPLLVSAGTCQVPSPSENDVEECEVNQNNQKERLVETEGGVLNTSSQDIVCHVEELMPLPKADMSAKKRRTRTTQASELTSSPYKTVLEQNQSQKRKKKVFPKLWHSNQRG